MSNPWWKPDGIYVDLLNMVDADRSCPGPVLIHSQHLTGMQPTKRGIDFLMDLCGMQFLDVFGRI